MKKAIATALILTTTALSPLPVLANTYGIGFTIDPYGPNREVVDLHLVTADTLTTGYGGFVGYQILSITGTTNGNAVTGPDPLQLVPLAAITGIPFVGTAPFLTADNLYNPNLAAYASRAGIGFHETANPSEVYQLFFSVASDSLALGTALGCPGCLVVQVPEPASMTLLGAGLLGLGALRRRQHPSG